MYDVLLQENIDFEVPRKMYYQTSCIITMDSNQLSRLLKVAFVVYEKLSQKLQFQITITESDVLKLV